MATAVIGTNADVALIIIAVNCCGYVDFVKSTEHQNKSQDVSSCRKREHQQMQMYRGTEMNPAGTQTKSSKRRMSVIVCVNAGEREKE